MSGEKKVLLIGLDPAEVNYTKWPGLTKEKLEGALQTDEKTLNDAGYGAAICFIDHGETAEAAVRKALAENSYSCVLIGAGVRIDSDEFFLFEKIINVVHKVAPDANICLNTGPTDSFDAIKRWC